ncbi:transcriptional regulator [Paeniglutamicibacter sp. ABSL32-1]|uniref:transcriptional regulator n=1 Tax=Paeniglutamicibacter quisquiliarum TaxID=2849498 RepID=UPI001C2DA211|nr:transcriptional regulator [Paeniglutamicibacter quisquiliarum]MBV1778889.1 transcriptional regulator [Paeniglutamicibacter quisquiliarum]
MNVPSSPASFDDLIHAPVRLRICASLAPVQWVEFAQLRGALAIADSVLSKHLKQLADAGYVDIERFAKGGRSHVRVALTVTGRKAYVGHVAALRNMLEPDA